MDPLKRAFITQASTCARIVGHPWPVMAACEAALESRWGESQLYIEAWNCFGMKQHVHPQYGSINLPTREFLNDQWKTVDAFFVRYPDLDSCFEDRLATLTRLASVYPHYKAALAAPDPQTYIREVSKTWSTDPQRAQNVIAIYNDYCEDVAGSPAD